MRALGPQMVGFSDRKKNQKPSIPIEKTRISA